MQVIDRFADFYGSLSSGDVRLLKEVYAANVEFIDPVATHNGIDALEAYFEALLSGTHQCDFTIHHITAAEDKYFTSWTMTFRSDRLNSGKPVTVDGLSELRTEDDKVVFHRDYYDMGEMIYENIPLLGLLVKKIKQRLAQ